MNIALACLTMLLATAKAQTAPTSASVFPEYNLTDYQNWKCDGQENCLSLYPTYSGLTWAPLPDSAVWEPEYWRWTVDSYPFLFIKCRQDYYPQPPEYNTCV